MFKKLKRGIRQRINGMANQYILQNSYISSVCMAAAIANRECFRDIKNCNAGKSIAICGGGPTLQKYVPIPDTLHIALNRSLLNKNVKYDWFIADDWEGVYFFQDELLNYDCRKFFGHQIGGDYSRQIPESFRIACNASRYYTDSFMVNDGFESRFACDIDKMPVGNMPNIALSAMQIALFTHPKRIYLVGCDASQGHFVQPDALDDKTIERHEKDLKLAVSSDRVIQKWQEMKEFAQAFYPDVEIVSVNPVGLKGIFTDIYQGQG